VVEETVLAPSTLQLKDLLIENPCIISDCTMKLDTRAMRHLASEDWRVLTAVRLRSMHLDEAIYTELTSHTG
jgi:hypothetical protein